MKFVILLSVLFLCSCSSKVQKVDLWDVVLNLPSDAEVSEIGGGDSQHGYFIINEKKVYFDIGAMGGYHLREDAEDIGDYENYRYFVSNDQKLVFFAVTRKEDKMFIIGGRNHSFMFMAKEPSKNLQSLLVSIAKRTTKKLEPTVN